MTSTKDGAALTYFSYFTKYVNPPRAEDKPLWTPKWFDGSENCQTQLVNQDCYAEPSETYRCHICNINVPKMCYQKHNQSNQHETIKKISEKVLERVSKQMYVNSVIIDKDIDQSMYYCEPCSIIIKIENKNNHEATEYHANSVKRSVILNDFYKIMTEKIIFNVKEELFREEKSIPFNPNNNYNETQDMEVCSSIDPEEIEDDLFDQNCNILPPVEVQNVIEIKNVSTEEEKELSFGEYLKEMIKKYELKVTLPIVDGDFIKIVAPNGDSVKVSRDNFHGYQENTSTYCLLCSEWIPKSTRLHDISEKHVRIIFSPINDNFVRGIDENWNHCIPCNELFPTLSDLHTSNCGHKTIINKTLIPKTVKTLCKDCNIYIDTNNITVHVKSNKHLMKHNCIQEGYNNIFCKICNITLPKNVLNKHINTELHLTRTATKKINDENNKNKANTESNEKNKEKNIDANNRMTECFDKTEAKVSGKVGSDNTDSNDRSAVEHNIEGRNHTKAQKLEAYNKLMVYADVEKIQLMCQICDVRVRDVDSEVIKHMESQDHKLPENEFLRFHSITRLSSGFICGCCSFRTTDYIDHINSRSHTLELAKKKLIDRTQMRKFVYDYKTINNITAQLHRHLYSNLLKHNGIFKVGDACFNCCVCCIKLSRTSEISHVLGERHLNSIDELWARFSNYE